MGEVCPHEIVTCPNCSPITSSSFPQPSVCHATLAGTAVAITQRVGIVNVMYYTASQILQYCTHDTSTLRILPFLPDPGWTFDFFSVFCKKDKMGKSRFIIPRLLLHCIPMTPSPRNEECIVTQTAK